MKNSIDAEIESAIIGGAVSALRKQAKFQADRAKVGESSPEKYPEIIIRTGESVIAASLANTFLEIATELERETATI